MIIFMLTVWRDLSVTLRSAWLIPYVVFVHLTFQPTQDSISCSTSAPTQVSEESELKSGDGSELICVRPALLCANCANQDKDNFNRWWLKKVHFWMSELSEWSWLQHWLVLFVHRLVCALANCFGQCHFETRALTWKPWVLGTWAQRLFFSSFPLKGTQKMSFHSRLLSFDRSTLAWFTFDKSHEAEIFFSIFIPFDNNKFWFELAEKCTFWTVLKKYNRVRYISWIEREK